MNFKQTIIFSIAVLAGQVCLAQDAIVEDFKPSTLNQPGQEYPQVNSQGYARFRIKAPYADSVKVSLGLGGRGGTILKQTADSMWMGTTEGPMDEGFHYYHVTIDGGVFNDPGTLNFYGSARWESGIEIPAHDQDFYALKDVPHGNVHKYFFLLKAPIHSVVLSCTRHRDMKQINQKNILCYTCNMAGAKMKLHGATRVMPILSWIT